MPLGEPPSGTAGGGTAAGGTAGGGTSGGGTSGGGTNGCGTTGCCATGGGGSGAGCCAAAGSINDRRSVSRVYHDNVGGPAYCAPPPVAGTREYVERDYVPPASGETIVDERRYD